MKYEYGEEVDYKYDLIEPEDMEKLQAFSCGNQKLDTYIHEELFVNGMVDTEDGLPFKVWDVNTGEVFAVFSLAASGIVWKVDNYTHILPAIKIDILAVDKRYQKMHMDIYSKESTNPDEHYYLSDSVMCEIIKHCRDIAEKRATAKYIILYADKKAKRFYKRNMFNDFIEFMEKENNMEIMKNEPMYMELD